MAQPARNSAGFFANGPGSAPAAIGSDARIDAIAVRCAAPGGWDARTAALNALARSATVVDGLPRSAAVSTSVLNVTNNALWSGGDVDVLRASTSGSAISPAATCWLQKN